MFSEVRRPPFIAMGITLLLLLLLLLGFLGLRWFCVGYVGITLVALVFRWLRWYFIGSYPLAKC